MSWALDFLSRLCFPASQLSSCFDSFFALESTAALSSFMRCLGEREKVANLGSAVWHPKALSFCSWCKRYEVVSGCCLESYWFVRWCLVAFSWCWHGGFPQASLCILCLWIRPQGVVLLHIHPWRNLACSGCVY